MSSSSLPTHFRLVKEGKGGTLHFREPDDEEVEMGLVYFKIDAHLYFFTHIDAFRLPIHLWLSRENFVNSKEGEQLKQDVIRRFQAEAIQHEWTASMIDKKSVILVCPNPLAVPTGSTPPERPLEKRTGGWVIDGVKEFLGLPRDQDVDKASEGFVVNHKTGGKVMIPYPVNSHPMAMELPYAPIGYTEETELHVDTWRFPVAPVDMES